MDCNIKKIQNTKKIKNKIFKLTKNKIIIKFYQIH